MDLYQEVILFVNGQQHKVDAKKLSPTTTLNTFLRDHLHLTGTKRLCLEGGCGACVVAVNRRNSLTGQYETFAVNSCLLSVFSCYGWEIYTIEGIGNSSSPHKLQNAITKFHGTQCGYCTPGMIMNMFALKESDENLTMKKVENSFGGNICRCTGYRSILAAFKSECKDATPDLTQKYPDIEEVPKCYWMNQTNENLRVNSSFYYKLDGMSWIKIVNFIDLLQVIKTFQNGRKTAYKLVAGNTAKGVYKSNTDVSIHVDIQNVPDLIQHKMTKNGLVLGANMSLTAAMKLFNEMSDKYAHFKYLKKIADHIDLIANVPVRNVGTLAGNLMIKHEHNEFPSDIFLLLETVGATLNIVDMENLEVNVRPSEFLKVIMDDRVMKRITLPVLGKAYHFESYKIMPRAQNAHALVNAGFLLKLNLSNKVEEANIVFGCINPNFIHATNTEKYLIGKDIFDNSVLQNTFKILNDELVPNFVPPDPSPDFRKKLAISLFYKYILSIAPTELISKWNISGRSKLERPVSSGSQSFETIESMYPVSKPMAKIESVHQTTGEAEFISDMPDLPNQLYAAFVLAKTAPCSIIVKIDTDKALKTEGVVAYFDKNDIPGKNTFTPKEASLFLSDLEEELFCGGIVKYHSQPIGIIVANSREIAEKAADLVEVTYQKGEETPVYKIRDLLKQKPWKVRQDRVDEPKVKGKDIKHVVEGKFDIGWQSHFYMETQCCNVIFKEDGLQMYPSTQWMDLSQNAAAAVLNIPANKIDVSVKRIGGAFGAKIVRNAQIAAAAALASFKLKKPVKLWLPLEKNMRIIGKRDPVSSDYEVATDANGIIQYLNNTIFVDHGQGGNETCMFLLFDTFMETYNSESWYANSSFTYTDMHSACYTRAPGSLEGLAMVEAIMEHTAYAIGMDPLEFKMKNISKKYPKISDYINHLRKWAEIDKRKQDIDNFNKENRWRKKGISVVPMVYPFPLLFSFGVIVSIYHSDGSVALSHGGIEIGQGINTKAVQVCAYKLGIPVEKVSVKPSNNLAAANSAMTGASLTSESICWAIMNACDILLERMKPIKETMENPTWEELVKKCFENFVHLTASTINSPKDPKLQGYVVYGVCSSEIELDVLTGQYQVSRVDLLEDVGDSMNPEIDIGQIEGGFVMGLGYFTSEEIIVSEEGEILTNRTWNYKPPGAKDIPIDFRIKFPGNNPNPVGILKSKAVSEPPTCLSVSIPLAIRNAVASCREDTDKTAPKWYQFDGPSTVENTFVNCLQNWKQYTL